MKKVGIILANGFEEIEAVTPIDVLRRAGLEVVTLGLNGKTIRGGHNIIIECDYEFNDYTGSLDALVLPGGMPGAENLSNSSGVLDLINRLHKEGKYICALCASPGVVLGKTALLKNRNFTCYPGFEGRVEGGHFLEDRVVVHGNIITSRGPGTALEFSLAIVSELISSEVSNKLCNGMIVK
ncbi:MAG: DJ-1/PfpI family protein [Spirochaetales bacterium]|nr:DJ-1/PfpI family protein [Spirochaetales bacterium]